ncbi:MAG: FlgD immunoglobulin-like domain containing protein [bacterium]|nr:FlgD immunoglobulin-like domain containing protein [bacterium]
MKRSITFLLLYSIFNILYSGQAVGQTLYNLQIMWQKASPDTGGGLRYWGFNMVGGDLNGDGYSDFVSATDTTLGIGTDRVKCKIYIFKGGSTLSTDPSQIITYDSLGSYPSFCIADFNGDSINDLALGDYRGTGTNNEKGQVNIHYGTGVDLNPTPDLVIGGYGSATATNYGYTVSAGDINGDNIADLIVDAPNYPISGNRNGRIYIYYGDILGLHTWPDIILNGHPSPTFYENFGSGKSDFCDLNQDGYDDIIASGPVNSINGIASGKVYYYLSKNAPLDTIADGWIYGEGAEQYLGANNLSNVKAETTGFKPISWFGTPDWPSTTGSFGEGKCYMAPGDTTGELTPEWTITGEDTALGFWSSSAGYADKDKLGDFLAGAAPAFNRTGKAYLWLQRPTMRTQYDAYILGRYAGGTGIGDVLGARVAPAGDVDSCGRDEFLVSNYYADSSNMIWLCKYTGPDGITGEPEFKTQNLKFKIYQNSPNPFSQSTIIKYQLSQAGRVSLKVYNVAGQLVKTLIIGQVGAGQHTVKWDGRDNIGNKVSSGIYIYRLSAVGQAENKDMTKKLVVLR